MAPKMNLPKQTQVESAHRERPPEAEAFQVRQVPLRVLPAAQPEAARQEGPRQDPGHLLRGLRLGLLRDQQDEGAQGGGDSIDKLLA